MDKLWYFLSFVSVFGTFIPWISYDYWLVRSQEYLKYYYLIINIVLLIVGVLFMDFDPYFYSTVALLGLAIIHCNQKITPYTPLATETLPLSKVNPEKKLIKILIFNVYQGNDAYSKLKNLVFEYDPDIISLFETNKEWAENIKELKSEYQHGVQKIQENTYGTILFSKIPLMDSKINSFVTDEIPSTEVVIDTEDKSLRILGLHPRPPIVGESNYATGKNKEFTKVYKYILSQSRDEHLIVHGDLNDVAWGKYPKLLKKKLNLRDPRIGRGFYPTFPTYFPLKIPLDHLYLSPKIELIDFKLLRDIGSDHFPVYAEIQV